MYKFKLQIACKNIKTPDYLSGVFILCVYMESNHGPLSYQDSVLPLNYTRVTPIVNEILPLKRLRLYTRGDLLYQIFTIFQLARKNSTLGNSADTSARFCGANDVSRTEGKFRRKNLPVYPKYYSSESSTSPNSPTCRASIILSIFPSMMPSIFEKF